MLKNDANFREEFECIFNNDEILESDEVEYTPDTLEDTYLKMEVALPRYGEGPELACVINQNPVKGVIRELRRKLYRVMVRRQVPWELWDYGIIWVSETTSLTHSSAGKLEGVIPITQVTGETADIPEYLDFGFYEQV